MISMVRRLILLSLLLGNTAFSAPGHFTAVIGSALMCRDSVSAIYFNEYMQKFFGSPAFSGGGANWWKVNENLFNSSAEYVFVGVDLDFIGATFKSSPAELIANIREATGTEYKQTSTEKWVSSSYGVLIRYRDRNTPSKMYCVGSPHTPF
ncbi:MAG: hypothetical protein A2063_05125 [Gallionellales bacterium GWA2_60_142]|jgi:hypothetical protein|nr:MAG: hypothetical protein A2063_05125 [Gallionellales bacterium GWA2_60_142]HCI14898.1 hypothetical protein [Gallionellaceae bacterium]